MPRPVTPTVGRIVHYRRRDDEVLAAIIARVHDKKLGICDLTIFPPRSMPFTERSIRGKQAGDWEWPEREGE